MQLDFMYNILGLFLRIGTERDDNRTAVHIMLPMFVFTILVKCMVIRDWNVHVAYDVNIIFSKKLEKRVAIIQ
jgi:hypothetical protein